MIYLFVELSSYKQLSRLRAQSVDEIVSSLKGAVDYSGGSCEFCEGGILLFSIDPLESPVEGVVELIHRVYGLLLGKRRELQGFDVVAEQSSGTSLSVLAQMHRAAAAANRPDALWLGRNLWGLLGEEFTGEESGDLIRVVERQGPGGRSSRDAEAFLVRSGVVGRIASAVEGLSTRRSKPAWLRIVAPQAGGGTANLRRALGSSEESGGTSEWIYLGKGRDFLSILEPFLDAVRSDLLRMVPELLSKSDRLLWEERSTILRFACPDHAVEDFFSVFSLYLLAYLRYRKERNRPAVVICPDADRYPAGSLRILARLLAQISRFGTLVLVCVTAEEGPLGELERISHESLLIEPLERAEIGERLAEFDWLGSVDPDEMEEVSEGQPLFLYHACLLGGPTGVRGIHLSLELLNERDRTARIILYASSVSRGMLSKQQVAQFLEGYGVPEDIYRREYAALIRLGFLDGDTGEVVLDEVVPLIAAGLETEGLPARIADFSFGLWQSGWLLTTSSNLARVERLFWFLSRNGRFEQAILVFVTLMSRLLEQGRVDDALRYLEQEDLFRMSLTSEETRRRDFFIELTALRAAILLESREQADLRLVRLREMQIDGERERGLLDLVSAQHHYAAHEYKLSLEAAKRALISAQATNSGIAECRADLEIGLTMLATTRLEESEEYFLLARTAEPEAAAIFEHIRSRIFEAVTLFLYGNISKALTIAESAGRLADRAGCREWQRLTLLLRGRCYFSLGIYEEALKLFTAGSAFCRIYPSDDASRVFQAWSGRCMVYSRSGAARSLFAELPRTAEVLFFLSEAAAEAGDEAAARELVDECLSLHCSQPPEYLPSETVPWYSGFAAIEDRALVKPSGTGVLCIGARAYRAYLQGRSGQVEEAVAEFVRLSREERLSDHDPNNAYYHYLHSRVVPHGEGELLVDRLTVLSKALKHVQERATRIDDVRKRQSFLRENLWNARLLEDANAMKLL